MNTKVKRMLKTIALVCKDENPNLIKAIHNVVVDKRDGYNFNFMQAALTARICVKGKSY